jgi:hypothetical protein
MKGEKCDCCKLPEFELEDYEGVKICKKCQLSIFQITDILETYLKEDAPPKWIINIVKELAWIYKKNPRTMGYFNTAEEISKVFLFDSVTKISNEELKELNYSTLPNNKILSLLKEGLIVELNDEYILPGPLVKKLQQVKWEEVAISAPRLQSKLLELNGIVTIAITRAMITTKEQIPRQSLSIFHLLSNQILLSDDDEDVENIIPEYSFEGTMFSLLNNMQVDRVLRTMTGFGDGSTKLIEDIDDHNEIHLNKTTTIYLNQMRERWRTRVRDRARS